MVKIESEVTARLNAKTFRQEENHKNRLDETKHEGYTIKQTQTVKRTSTVPAMKDTDE